MGGRGTFASGKNVDFRWHSVDIIEGFKVLRLNVGKTTKIPGESHSPNAKYVNYDEETGKFKMLRVYNKNRLPELEIAEGTHQGVKGLHWHLLHGDVANHNIQGTQGVDWDWLHKGDPLYKKYKTIIEGKYHGK